MSSCAPRPPPPRRSSARQAFSQSRNSARRSANRFAQASSYVEAPRNALKQAAAVVPRRRGLGLRHSYRLKESVATASHISPEKRKPTRQLEAVVVRFDPTGDGMQPNRQLTCPPLWPQRSRDLSPFPAEIARAGRLRRSPSIIRLGRNREAGDAPDVLIAITRRRSGPMCRSSPAAWSSPTKASSAPQPRQGGLECNPPTQALQMAAVRLNIRSHVEG